MLQSKNPKVSVVIPVYKPDEEVFVKMKEMLKTQTVPVEIVEKWNNPEAVSMNLGVKEANGEIIVILAQDCVPENEHYIEKMIKPLEKNDVVAVVSDLILPVEHWEKRPFFVRMFTISDLKIKKPAMNLSSCAYRKKDLEKVGYISENVSAIDIDFARKIRNVGKIERGNAVIYHIHPHYGYKKMLKTFYSYSRFNGIVIREEGAKNINNLQRLLRATPILGFGSIYFRYPWKKKFYLAPLHFFTAGVIEHAVNVIGFWHGFFFGDADGGSRNKEVLSESKKKILEEQNKKD